MVALWLDEGYTWVVVVSKDSRNIVLASTLVNEIIARARTLLRGSGLPFSLVVLALSKLFRSGKLQYVPKNSRCFCFCCSAESGHFAKTCATILSRQPNMDFFRQGRSS